MFQTVSSETVNFDTLRSAKMNRIGHACTFSSLLKRLALYPVHVFTVSVYGLCVCACGQLLVLDSALLFLLIHYNAYHVAL